MWTMFKENIAQQNLMIFQDFNDKIIQTMQKMKQVLT